ncbi:amino acid ABC transporter, permease protein [Vibrio cholerae NCTC 8457]|nr:amino acid ABC transporter, permease protein [Vibrio cholerae NCTC 8457]
MIDWRGTIVISILCAIELLSAGCLYALTFIICVFKQAEQRFLAY